jgi:hypothetical protein
MYRPSYTFVVGYLADHSRRRETLAAQHARLAGRTGRCAGCGVINCPGEDPEWCPLREGEEKRR